MHIVAESALKRLGVTLVVILLGFALIQKILAETPRAGVVVLAALLLASPAAYLLRRSCSATPLRRAGRQAARERTRAGF